MKLSVLLEEFDPNVKKDDKSYKNLVKTVSFLETKKKVLFLTTSNRGEWAVKELKEEPKSTILAKSVQNYLGKSKCTLIEVPKLKIYPCEGNVSHKDGNSCGVVKAKLKDKDKNPTGNHRCWRNINNPDDELWKISKELFDCDAVVFWGSIRWGQMNSEYQKLIERLTWLENRHSTLNESNILSKVSCGIISVGQNWRGKEVIEVQKQVLEFFGFDVKSELCWNWQYTMNKMDETQKSYKNSSVEFNETFELD
jgi:multimeric flavodoxin WrbA